MDYHPLIAHGIVLMAQGFLLTAHDIGFPHFGYQKCHKKEVWMYYIYHMIGMQVLAKDQGCCIKASSIGFPTGWPCIILDPPQYA